MLWLNRKTSFCHVCFTNHGRRAPFGPGGCVQVPGLETILGLGLRGAPTVDDINPALPEGPSTMGILVYSLSWVMQDLYRQPQYATQGFFCSA